MSYGKYMNVFFSKGKLNIHMRMASNVIGFTVRRNHIKRFQQIRLRPM